MSNEHRCPKCELAYDKTDIVDEAARPMAPVPGNLAVCMRCGQIGIFDDDLSVRKPTLQEAIEIAHDPDAIMFIHNVSAAIRRWKANLN